MRPIVHRLVLRPPPERPAIARQVLLVGLVAALALAAWFAWWQAMAAGAVTETAGRSLGCGLGYVAPGSHVAVVGAAGGGASGFALPGRHAARTGEVELLVTARRMPVHLVLVGHDPTIWRLGLGPGVSLAVVVVVAPRPQLVAGLPDGVAVRRLTGPDADCGLTLADLAAGGQGVPAALGREPDSVLVAASRGVVGPAPGAAAALKRRVDDAQVARLVGHRGDLGPR